MTETGTAYAESLRRELIAAQEMLAFAIKANGNKVVITKKELREGLPKGAEILIEDSTEQDAFVITLEVPDGQ